MSRSIEEDRAAQLLIGADTTLDYDEARLRLERATLVISAGAAARTAWGQAAILTLAECAVRMFRGGVYLGHVFGERIIVGCRLPVSLQSKLIAIGCRREAPPAHAMTLHIGNDVPHTAKVLRCWADGWVATVSPRPPAVDPREGNEISGALAGALAASEAFRSLVLNDIRAGKRTQRVSPLTPTDPQPAGLSLTRLPARCWLLGLGNLGQANLWVLSLLPYADAAAVELYLQDTDTSGPENLDVQLLTRFSWIDQKKARAAAAWAEAHGFRNTKVIERRFDTGTRRSSREPGLIFVGVDNLETRRAVPGAGFDLVIDGGLGATPAEVFDLRIHGFPGNRTPREAWPEPPPTMEKPLNPALSRLVEQGRLQICGATMIAGQPVGVPSTAVAAAAIQVAQACRAIADSTYCDLVDVSLADAKRASAHETKLARVGVIPFLEARQSGP
jgi:hypothetical protein